MAEGLPPQFLVTVRLADGTRLKGRLMELTADTLVIQRKTRLRVSPTVVNAAAVRSVSSDKEGASPGRKVVMVIGGIGLAVLAVAMTVLATVDY